MAADLQSVLNSLRVRLEGAIHAYTSAVATLRMLDNQLDTMSEASLDIEHRHHYCASHVKKVGDAKLAVIKSVCEVDVCISIVENELAVLCSDKA